MRPQKCSEEDYIQWLIASPKTASQTEAAKCCPKDMAHDAIRRMLLRTEPNTQALWLEAKEQVNRNGGFLVLDDTMIDKPYAKNIAMVTHNWSGKHKRLCKGITVVTMIWTDGTKMIPVDLRVYNKEHDGKSKNDHFRELLQVAKERGFINPTILFDSWYASKDNMRFIQQLGWRFYTQLKSNRRVHLEEVSHRPTIPLRKLISGKEGDIICLKGAEDLPPLRVFRVSYRSIPRYSCTNDLSLDLAECKELSRIRFAIEHFHRGLKQECNIERCSCRDERIQRNHILFAFRAFLRLEVYRNSMKLAPAEFCAKIIRDSIQKYLANPYLIIPGFA